MPGRSPCRWPLLAPARQGRLADRSRYALRYVKIGCIRIPKGEVISVSPATGVPRGTAASAWVYRSVAARPALTRSSTLSKVVASDGGGLTGTNGHPSPADFNSEAGSTVCIWRARMSIRSPRSVSVAICSQHQLGRFQRAPNW